MTQLSENFTLEELSHSDTAVRLGIDNTPPPEIVPHLVVLANWLELVLKVLGHKPTLHSGYRCEALERILSAKDFSAWCTRHKREPRTSWDEYFARKGHPKGYCEDFTCKAFGTPLEIVRVLKGSGIKFDQLIEEGTWVHGSADPRLRGEVLTATFDANGVSYQQGVV